MGIINLVPRASFLRQYWPAYWPGQIRNSITKGSLIIPNCYSLALARNWSNLDRCHGKTGQRIEKRIVGILECSALASVDGI